MKRYLLETTRIINLMPENDKLVVWPVYFDSERSRHEGRMVRLEDAVKHPSIDDLVKAAIKAGLKPIIERDKKHPKTWYESSGRILVLKKGSKNEVLKSIAKHMQVLKKH
jgi:signal recognition particle subunit SRP19